MVLRNPASGGTREIPWRGLKINTHLKWVLVIKGDAMLTFMDNLRKKIQKKTIKNAAINRGIANFIHFTNIENVYSIVYNGLLTRNFMDNEKIAYCYNDEERYDNLKKSISLSITFPNYKMFYKLQCGHPEMRWSIIILRAEEVLDLDCIFCRTNAASNEMRRISVEERRTLQAFEDMFYERSDITRENMGLPSNYTTDPQAEILVCDNIPQNYIQCICVENKDDMEYLRNRGINSCVNRDYFAPRLDYEMW